MTRIKKFLIGLLMLGLMFSTPTVEAQEFADDEFIDGVVEEVLDGARELLFQFPSDELPARRRRFY